MNIKESRNGKTIISCENEEVVNGIKNKLETSIGNSYKVMNPTKRNPRLIIFHAEKQDIDREEIKANILAQYNISSTGNIFNVCQLIKLKKSMHMDPTTFFDLLKRGAMFVGWVKCRLSEFFDVIRCYKCSCYGHFANACKKTDVICPLCAETHDLKDCAKINIKCITCCNYNEKHKETFPIDHSTIYSMSKLSLEN